MFQKHCSDETLLALVDGELSRLGEWRTRRHLKICWRCRTHLAELEQQVQDFTRAFNKQDFPARAASMQRVTASLNEPPNTNGNSPAHLNSSLLPRSGDSTPRH